MDSIMKKRRSRAYVLLIFASVFLYLTLTASKNLYTAEKTTLHELGTFGNLTDLATTMEYYFYTYAATQIALAFFMKKINIKWFLTVTVGISAILTMLVSFTSGIGQHYIIFAINGMLQAGIWGILLKILSIYLPMRLLPIANQIMSAGPAAASATAYGVAALFGDNWKLPFFILGALLLFSVVLYTMSVNIVAKFPKDMSTHHIVMSDGTETDVSDEEDNDFIHLNSKRRVAVFYIISIFIGFFVTSIYFMVNNNLDVYLKEIGGFSNSIAKILTVFAPLAAVVGPLVCVRSCERHRNFVAVAAVYFGLALAVMTAVLFVFDKSVIAALALMVLFLVLANGGRSVSLSIAALKMRTKIDTGVYSTVVNAVASIASGVTPKIITSILDRESLSVTESWRMSLGIIFAVNLFAVLALMLIIIWIKLANRKGRQINEISEEN